LNKTTTCNKKYSAFGGYTRPTERIQPFGQAAKIEDDSINKHSSKIEKMGN